MRAPAAALACALAAQGALAIDHLSPGDPVPRDPLPVLGGGEARPLVSPGRVSVFVFFRPHQDHSADALRKLADLAAELGDRPVSFAAVASSSWTAAELAEAARAAGLRMPVLVDEGDRLYGALGVRLHPLVGVAGADGRLAAWEPFRDVNYREVLRARVLFALGEISEAEVARALSPPRGTMPGDDPRMVARRDVTLGRMLLSRGNAAKALESALRALALDPASAAAHALAGEAQAAGGDCAAARASFDRALALDPAEAAAEAGRKAPCTPAVRP